MIDDAPGVDGLGRAPGLVDRVPGVYVHKTDESEILLAAYRRSGPDAFRVVARWPTRHRFYRPVHGGYDPLLVAESVRQAVPLLSHAGYDVPFGHRQSWDYFRCTADMAALAATADRPEVELHITCADVVRRAGRLVSLSMRVRMIRGGRTIGRAELGFHNHSPAIYAWLRGRYGDLDAALAGALPPAPPMAPADVARDSLTDVVLSPAGSPARSRLRVDLTHPVLFDHPVDHIPGMLLLEGARQAAHAALAPTPMAVIGMDASFHRYAELDAPCWIEAESESGAGTADGAAARRTVRVTARQGAVRRFTCTVLLDPP
ncbi:ScbA/BarX family gamma-butyrolactone biosynthesis protein [Streptomyces sp. NPDC000927]|uniref:ScbA/BarX family gamma-butyrolactone biosynthesis protein n=1 Tax=unclassified Streptomyces TaxID=2593676 RepID=UPI00332C98B2